MNPILESIHHNKHLLHSVSINDDGIDQFVAAYDRNKAKHWLNISPFDITQLNEHQLIHFLVLLNAISFSYWGAPKWRIEHNGQTYDGAQAMMVALGRAFEQNASVLEPKIWATMDEKRFANMLHGSTKIPLFTQRLQHIQKIGWTLENRYQGDFRTVIKGANNNTLQLVKFVVQTFPSFNDVRQIKKCTVQFYKRAQLLAGDISHAFDGLLSGAEQLTACADYKLPQVLRRYGVLQYSSDLEQRIHRHEMIPEGSEAEIAIRAHTILAVEKIREQLSERIPSITSLEVNDVIWLEGQKKLPNDEPYHRIRTTAY